MKNTITLFLIFFLSTFIVSGQENRLRFEIQQAKESNIYFENAVLSEVSADTKVLEKFINVDDVFFFGNISLDVKNNNTKAMNLTIPMNNKNMVLELVEVPESFYNYVVMTSDGEQISANRDIKHYRGVVRDEQNSLAAITVYENEVIGLICSDEGNFNIVKDKQSGKHLFFNDKNLKERTPFICGTVDDLSFSYDPEVLLKPRSNLSEQQSTLRSAVIDEVVRFYVETEYDIYQNKGSISSVETFISGLFNQVSLLYQNEDILTSVSCIYIWISNDPYTATTPTSLLTQFQNTRTSIIGDLGILLTFRDLGGGGAATTMTGSSGLCQPLTSNKLAVTQLETIYKNVPNYSESVHFATHELGHLFGSRHTHACVWIVNNVPNSAIDGCYSVEGNCPQPGYPSKGTIMSYCHLSGRPEVNFNLGFGIQPGNVIRDRVINASCLHPCNSPLNFTNQTVTQGVIINSCKDINVQNVNVTSGGKLILNATGTTKITNSFKVELGSQLEIK